MGVSKYNRDVIKYGDEGNVAPGGGGLTASVQTSNYTITESEDVGVDSTGGTFTITLKASPEAGDVAIIRDVGQNCGTTNVAIARNGSTINGAATDENLDVDNGMYMFVYNGTTWKFTPFSGPGLNEAEVIAVTTGAERLWLVPGIDLWPLGALATSVSTLGASVYRKSNYFSLSSTADVNFCFNKPLPKRWDAGTVRFRFFWITTSTNTGDVALRALTIPATSDAQVFDDTVGATVKVYDTATGVDNRLHISSWTSELTLSGAADDTMTAIIMQRQAGSDANDTHNSAIELIGVEMEWTSSAPTDD